MKTILGRLRREEAGFTLVELLVVIAILAILVAVVVPNFTGLIGKGELQTYNAEKKTTQTIVDAYLSDNRISAFTAAWYVLHTVIPSGAKAPGTGLIEDYFRQATRWCWSVSTTGKVVNEQVAANCGALTPPAIPTGGTA